MSRKSDKFFIYSPKKRGPYKGMRMLGVNHTYGGGLTAQDLVDFLKEKNVEASKVILPKGFITFAEE